MKVSEQGVAFIKRWEGRRLKAYRDGGGVLTIGYGHTSMAGAPEVTVGMVITETEADGIFRHDLIKYEKAVLARIARPASQNQFDAMVSLCYNIGPTAFTRSSVVRCFNAGEIAAAADAFLLWNRDGKKVIEGLKNRRRDERFVFLSVDSTPTPVKAPTMWERFKAWFTK